MEETQAGQLEISEDSPVNATSSSPSENLEIVVSPPIAVSPPIVVSPPPSTEVIERSAGSNERKKSAVFLRGEQIPYLFEHLHGKDAKPPATNSILCSDPISDEYIEFVARTGRPLFDWPTLKPLFLWKLETIMLKVSQAGPFDQLPKTSNTDRSSSRQYMERILSASQSLTGVPFTIQRICELLSQPKKHYKRADRFFRALEKNIGVVTTVDVEGRRETERQPEEVAPITDSSNISVITNDVANDVTNDVTNNVNEEEEITYNHTPQ